MPRERWQIIHCAARVWFIAVGDHRHKCVLTVYGCRANYCSGVDFAVKERLSAKTQAQGFGLPMASLLLRQIGCLVLGSCGRAGKR